MTPNASVAIEPGELIRNHQAALAEDLVTRQFSAHPELQKRFGLEGRQKCLQDANYHLAYLADALSAGDPALFSNYIAWAKVMLGKRGIPASDLVRHLESMRSVIKDSLGEAGSLALEYLNIGLTRLPSVPSDLPSLITDDSPHGALAKAYLESLLNGERHAASRMILEAVANKVSVKEIYLHVFQVAQYEVGRKWQINEISVAQEHYCTAATQLIMSQLYSHIFASEKGEGTLVATCVSGDLHEIGVRMVADFFEMEGWNTFYLGANMPSPAIVDTVVQRRAQVLGISATISSHLKAVGELISLVRGNPACASVKILVGGYPFIASPGLWQKMGADGFAANAQDAINLARQLVPKGESQ